MDRTLNRIIAGGLLSVALVVVIGGMWLTNVGRQIPDALIALGSAALGGLSTFLVSTRHEGETQAVQVVNRDDQPVPVDSTPAYDIVEKGGKQPPNPPPPPKAQRNLPAPP